MYCTLGTFDPSNEHIEKCKDKNILDKYKQISDIKLTKANIIKLHHLTIGYNDDERKQ